MPGVQHRRGHLERVGAAAFIWLKPDRITSVIANSCMRISVQPPRQCTSSDRIWQAQTLPMRPPQLCSGIWQAAYRHSAAHLQEPARQQTVYTLRFTTGPRP